MKNEIIKGDVFEHLKKIKDKSINLAIIDPPYFRIMLQDHTGEKFEWDNQWKNIEEYQLWINKLGLELKRVLTDNGCFYIFADDKICAYVQVILDRHFALINNITWVKPNNLTIKGWSEYRSYSPITERILFYSNEWDIKSGQLIYDKILEEHLKPKNNFAKYLRDEFKRANVTAREISKLFPSRTGGLTGCVSNWMNGDSIITEEQYKKVREYLNRDLKKDYEYLKKDYEDLKKDYEELRRPFNPKRNYTDVWTFNIIGGKENLRHPTQKLLKLVRRMVIVSSKEGDIVLDLFAGTGTTSLACKQLNRNSIAIEKEKEYIKIINKRLAQKTLFEVEKLNPQHMLTASTVIKGEKA